MTFLTYTVLQAITEILLNIWLKTPHLELYKNNLYLWKNLTNEVK